MNIGSTIQLQNRNSEIFNGATADFNWANFSGNLSGSEIQERLRKEIQGLETSLDGQHTLIIMQSGLEELSTENREIFIQTLGNECNKAVSNEGPNGDVECVLSGCGLLQGEKLTKTEVAVPADDGQTSAQSSKHYLGATEPSVPKQELAAVAGGSGS